LPRFDLQVALDDTYNIKKKPCGAYRTLGFRKNAMTVAGQLTGTATDPRSMTPEEQTAKLASALDEQNSNLVYPIRLLELKKVSIGERGRRSGFVLDAGAIFQDASGNISRLDFVVRMTNIVASHSSKLSPNGFQMGAGSWYPTLRSIKASFNKDAIDRYASTNNIRKAD
jgi:hypothetical protein